MPQYILALDQGTTSSRAIAFDRSGNIAALSQQPLPQHYPQAGWVEHDPLEIWDTQRRAAAEVIARLPEGSVAGIGVTNQRETTILWDKATGQPVYNAIVWQCRRTAELCEELKRRGLEERIRSATGLLIDAYFSGSKIRWILDNVPGVRRRAERGEVLFGTVESWLIWKLTGAPCDRLRQRQPHHAVRHPPTLLGRGAVRHTGRAHGHAACAGAQQHGVRHGAAGHTGSGIAGGDRRCAARRATSRPPCSGRPASPPAKPRTPTAPAASP